KLTKMKTENIINVYPFNDRGNMEKAYQYKTIESVQNRLKEIYSSPFHTSFTNVSSSGIERIMAIAYDFRPFLKKILVKQYGSWQEYYAPNKTLLRNALYGRIEAMKYI